MANLAETNPNIAYDDQAYNRLNLLFTGVKQNQTRAEGIVKEYNESLLKNYNLVKESGLYDDYEVVEGFKETGLDFEIVEQTEDGPRLMPKEEFVARYVEGAKQGKYKDDLGWWSRNTWFGKDSGHDANYMTDEVTYVPTMSNYGGYHSVKTGRKIFNTEEAKEDAATLYDHMYTMLNNTVNGSYTGEAEQIKNLQKEGKSVKGVTPDLTTAGAQVGFTVYDPRLAWEGKAQSGILGDLVSSPTYEYTVDPFVINSDPTAIGLVKDIINQINITPNASMTIQPGNIASKEKANYNAVSDKFAQTLIENWIRDVRSISMNPDQPKSNSPLATISYAPSYGKDKASYIFKFDPDWLADQKSLYTDKDGDVTSAQLKNYQTITFAFDQDLDISPRRSGQYNFSTVLAEINNTDNQQFKYDYTNGGSVSVVQNTNGDYIANVTLEYYDPTTLIKKNLPTQTYNLNEVIYNQTGTTDIMSYIDPIVFTFFGKALKDQAEANNKLYKETSANNNAK